MTGQEVGQVPKETIHADGQFHATVGWSPDRHVQVGVEGDEGRSLNWLLYGPQHPNDDVLSRLGASIRETVANDWPDPETIGRAVLNALDVLHGPEGYWGVWVTLDRAGCNRLIRVLRRARDAAYGADQ